MAKVLKAVLAGAGLLGLLASSAAAQAPVALVEDLQGKVAGVEYMDYVAAGRVIKLGDKASLVLGYLKSCWRETITGGTVTIGEEQSTVAQGKLVRSKASCDASRMQLSPQQATQGAATVFRGMQPEAPAPKQTLPLLYGQSPMVEVNASRGVLVIQRVDEAAERYEAPVAGKALVRERFLDLARTDIALKPGARYAASLGAQKVEFTIAWEAQPGATPLAGRLLRLP